MQRAADHSYPRFLQMWSADSLWTYCHSCTYTAVTMTLKFYPIPSIRRNSITKLRFNFIYTLPISFSFNISIFFGRVHDRPSKIVFCRRVLVRDSGPESESANFFRLQLQLRLQPKRSTLTDYNPVSAQTPQPCPWVPPKCCVALSQINVIKGQKVRKGQTQNFEFGWCDTMFLGNIFVKNAKMTLEHFLNGPNRTKV